MFTSERAKAVRATISSAAIRKGAMGIPKEVRVWRAKRAAAASVARRTPEQQRALTLAGVAARRGKRYPRGAAVAKGNQVRALKRRIWILPILGRVDYLRAAALEYHRHLQKRFHRGANARLVRGACE